MPVKLKIPVTQRAALQRMNRKLAKDGQRVVAVRGVARAKVGAWVLVDAKGNARPVEPAKLAAELGVLELWEVLAEEG